MMSEPSDKPDTSQLFIDSDGYLVFIAPVDLANEIASVREVLENAETWGDVKRAIPPDWYAELVDFKVAPVDQPPREDDMLAAPEDWPSLRYDDIPGWLPEAALNLGEEYVGRVDSGTNFLCEKEDEIVEALRDAGITVRTDGPDLPDLFQPM